MSEQLSRLRTEGKLNKRAIKGYLESNCRHYLALSLGRGRPEWQLEETDEQIHTVVQTLTQYGKIYEEALYELFQRLALEGTGRIQVVPEAGNEPVIVTKDVFQKYYQMFEDPDLEHIVLFEHQWEIPQDFATYVSGLSWKEHSTSLLFKGSGDRPDVVVLSRASALPEREQSRGGSSELILAVNEEGVAEGVMSAQEQARRKGSSAEAFALSLEQESRIAIRLIDIKNTLKDRAKKYHPEIIYYSHSLLFLLHNLELQDLFFLPEEGHGILYRHELPEQLTLQDLVQGRLSLETPFQRYLRPFRHAVSDIRNLYQDPSHHPRRICNYCRVCPFRDDCHDQYKGSFQEIPEFTLLPEQAVSEADARMGIEFLPEQNPAVLEELGALSKEHSIWGRKISEQGLTLQDVAQKREGLKEYLEQSSTPTALRIQLPLILRDALSIQLNRPVWASDKQELSLWSQLPLLDEKLGNRTSFMILSVGKEMARDLVYFVGFRWIHHHELLAEELLINSHINKSDEYLFAQEVLEALKKVDAQDLDLCFTWTLDSQKALYQLMQSLMDAEREGLVELTDEDRERIQNYYPAEKSCLPKVEQQKKYVDLRRAFRTVLSLPIGYRYTWRDCLSQLLPKEAALLNSPGRMIWQAYSDLPDFSIWHLYADFDRWKEQPTRWTDEELQEAAEKGREPTPFLVVETDSSTIGTWKSRSEIEDLLKRELRIFLDAQQLLLEELYKRIEVSSLSTLGDENCLPVSILSSLQKDRTARIAPFVQHEFGRNLQDYFILDTYVQDLHYLYSANALSWQTRFRLEGAWLDEVSILSQNKRKNGAIDIEAATTTPDPNSKLIGEDKSFDLLGFSIEGRTLLAGQVSIRKPQLELHSAKLKLYQSCNPRWGMKPLKGGQQGLAIEDLFGSPDYAKPLQLLSAPCSLGAEEPSWAGRQAGSIAEAYLSLRGAFPQERYVLSGTSELRPSQREAVETALSNIVSAIHGPPGTGKTFTLCELICTWIARRRAAGKSCRILVSAGQYSALTVLAKDLSRMSDRLGVPCYEFDFRRNAREEIRESFPRIRSLGKRDSVQEKEGLLLFSIVHKSPNLSKVAGCFDLILVDEASQLTTRQYLNLLRMVKYHRFQTLDELSEVPFHDLTQIVLAGDHMQLPPVQQAPIPEQLRWYLSSIFSYYLHNPMERYIPNVVLKENFRSEPMFVDAINALELYFNKSTEEKAADEDDVVPPEAVLLTPERSLLIERGMTQRAAWVDDLFSSSTAHTADLYRALKDSEFGFLTHSNRSDIKISSVEASLVIELAQEAIRTYALAHRNEAGASAEIDWVAFFNHEFGVVSPHNAQGIQIINSLILWIKREGAVHGMRLSDQIETALRNSVVSVEKYQGNARSFLVASFGVSAHDQLKSEEQFLYDIRRLNVLISRPKERLLIVCAQSLIDYTPSDPDAVFGNERLQKLYYQFCQRERELIYQDQRLRYVWRS